VIASAKRNQPNPYGERRTPSTKPTTDNSTTLNRSHKPQRTSPSALENQLRSKNTQSAPKTITVAVATSQISKLIFILELD